MTPSLTNATAEAFWDRYWKTPAGSLKIKIIFRTGRVLAAITRHAKHT
jgi:hypothetical protein